MARPALAFVLHRLEAALLAASLPLQDVHVIEA
jgi:hypothetical protein